LGAFGTNRHPQLLRRKKENFKRASTREREMSSSKRETKSSESEVQASDSSERVANKPSFFDSNCNHDLPTQGDLLVFLKWLEI